MTLTWLHATLSPRILMPIVAVAAVLSAILVRAMIRVAVLDHPVERSSHTMPTPKGGGVGIIVAFLACVAVAVTVFNMGGGVPVAALLIGVAGLSLISWMDDVRHWPATIKLAAQGVAAIMVAGGIIGPSPLPLLFGCGWLVYATNALNFIDGLNGLASGSMLIAAATLASLGGWTGATAIEAAALCGGIIGFLPLNFPRARIFMGDVGSQGAALAVGGIGLQLAQAAPHHAAALLYAPLILGAIVWDVAFTLVRRAIAGNALMQAHRGHLYQLAQRSFLPATAVTIIYWGFALWGAACAYGMAHANQTSAAGWCVVAALLPLPVWTALVCWQARLRLTVAW